MGLVTFVFVDFGENCSLKVILVLFCSKMAWGGLRAGGVLTLSAYVGAVTALDCVGLELYPVAAAGLASSSTSIGVEVGEGGFGFLGGGGGMSWSSTVFLEVVVLVIGGVFRPS